jgi:predicted ATPase
MTAASPAMIGRESDLHDLRTLFAESAKGQARAIVLAGEAGIGKTRLLYEFTSEAARSARVLSGQCVDLGQVATPYAPVTALLRTLVDQVGADAVLDAAGPGWEALSVLL